jgi:hypothetical protein
MRGRRTQRQQRRATKSNPIGSRTDVLTRIENTIHARHSPVSQPKFIVFVCRSRSLILHKSDRGSSTAEVFFWSVTQRKINETPVLAGILRKYCLKMPANTGVS